MTLCYFCHSPNWLGALICEQCRGIIVKDDLYFQTKGSLNIYSAFEYCNPLNKLIRVLKDGQDPDLAVAWGRLLGKMLLPKLSETIKGVVPVPSKRGVRDHAYYLAVGVADIFHSSIFSDALLHTQPGRDQKALSLMERSQLDFQLNSNVDFTKGHWILVDDVVTSGATLYLAWNRLGRPKAIGGTLGFTARTASIY